MTCLHFNLLSVFIFVYSGFKVGLKKEAKIDDNRHTVCLKEAIKSKAWISVL